MEQWKDIRDFPGYQVSDRGRVLNVNTGRIMALLRNQQGIINVGLTRDQVQYKRGVALLVAKHFLKPPPPLQEAFDTVIHFDGDHSNNYVTNLAWRPKWFAIEFQQQFAREPIGYKIPVRNVRTGEIFDNSWEAAKANGILEKSLVIAIHERTYVWPTYQQFEVIHHE